HFRIGGQKITQEKVDPAKRRELLSQKNASKQHHNYRDLFTQHWENTGGFLSSGGGLDFLLNLGMALCLANLAYFRCLVGTLGTNNLDRGLRFSAGLVLRVGTW